MQRVTMAEIARRDGVNRSTVKRYVDRYHLQGDDGLVDYTAYTQHRAENVSLEDAQSRPAPRDAKARRAEADAEIKELELAEKRGELIERGPFVSEMRDLLLALMADIDASIEPALRAQAVVNPGIVAEKVINAIHDKRRKAFLVLDDGETDVA